MAIEHDYFGLIETSEIGGIYWSERVDFDDQSVSVSLSAETEDTLHPDALDTAASMIATLDDLDLRAREAMIAELPDRSSAVNEYISLQVEEQGDDLEDFFTHVSGDRDIDLLRSIQVFGVRFNVLAMGDDDAFVTIEYALDPTAADDILVIALNLRGESVSIVLD